MTDPLERLQRIADHEMTAQDIESTKRSIDQLEGDGWLPDEIFRYLRWSEEVTESSVSEENCLKRMSKVREAVRTRLNKATEEGYDKLSDGWIG